MALPPNPPAHHHHHRLRLRRYVCIKDFISKWFWRMPVEQLTKANIGDLLAYGFLYKSREQLEAEGQGHLPDTMVSELEEAWDVRFNDGPYVKRSFMCHQWKPVRCHYRPLAFYAAIEYLIALKHVLMLAMGFAHAHHRGMAVYTYGEVGRAGPRDALSSVDGETVVAMAAEESMPPFMFLHGVGVGVLPYINFVQRLAATGRCAGSFTRRAPMHWAWAIDAGRVGHRLSMGCAAEYGWQRALWLLGC